MLPFARMQFRVATTDGKFIPVVDYASVPPTTGMASTFAPVAHGESPDNRWKPLSITAETVIAVRKKGHAMNSRERVLALSTAAATTAFPSSTKDARGSP